MQCSSSCRCDRQRTGWKAVAASDECVPLQCYLKSFTVSPQRRNVYPAASWLLDYIKVGIDYGTARRENNHALARVDTSTAHC